MGRSELTQAKTPGSKRRSRTHSSNLLRFPAPRLPDKKPALGVRYGVVQQECERSQHQDPGEHRIDIEGTFRLEDHVAHTFRRAEVFAHDGAHKCESNRVVQAREYPAHGARNIDVP